LPEGVLRYVGVDISAVALGRVHRDNVPVERVRTSLAEWNGAPAPIARRVLVASEVLYYYRAAVDDLRRVVDATGTVSEIIVSCVAAHRDKPNWATASKQLWADLAATGWPEIQYERFVDPATGIAWDITRYRIPAAG
jgi:hypothetical protein